MAREADAALQAKILQIGFVLVFIVAVLYGVRSMMFGSRSVVGIVAGFSIILAAVLALDREYWVLLPLISSSGLSIPSVPFSSPELGCLTLIGTFCVRATLRRDALHFETLHYVLWAFPYFLWCAVIFCLNPVGLHMFGSTMIGGRHYFHLALGFATLFVLSQIELSDRGLRFLFFGLIATSFLLVFSGYFGFLEIEDEIAEVHTRYYLQSFGAIVMLFLSRYDLLKILASPGVFLSCLLCSGLVLLSGKRTTVGTLLLMPFALMFLRRRGYVFTLSCGIIGAIALSILIAGHGRLYELPFSLQRGLSFLPGRWDTRLENYGFHDYFREELHRRAKSIIREHPWVGRKGFAMDVREISWVVLFTGARDTEFAGHEIAGNWHNKFYGMWADFGAIAPFSWYAFVIGVCFWGFRKRNYFLDNSYRATFYRYWLYSMFLDLVLAYGHSANTPFSRWQTFGLLLALHNMRRSQIEACAISGAGVDSASGTTM